MSHQNVINYVRTQRRPSTNHCNCCDTLLVREPETAQYKLCGGQDTFDRCRDINTGDSVIRDRADIFLNENITRYYLPYHVCKHFCLRGRPVSPNVVRPFAQSFILMLKIMMLRWWHNIWWHDDLITWWQGGIMTWSCADDWPWGK